VSTDQEEQLSSYENQVRYYTEMIEKNPEYELVDIYADEGISGTNTKKRDEFNRMIDDYRAGRIDLIITKSISRFARNTLDCLNYVRELKEKGVTIHFEKENINTMDAKGEVLLTILSSLAQDESRSISENSAWGIRRRFEQGNYRTSTKRFLGYDQDKNGKLVVNKAQAKVVKRIYHEYLLGKTPDRIAREFIAEKVKCWDGKSNWHVTTIDSMLRNEKYMGDVILQKSYTANFLEKKRVKNEGKLQKYHIQDDHEAIIDIDTWNAVQHEIARREAFCKEHHTNTYAVLTETKPLSGKIICGECNHLYTRVSYTYRDGRKVVKWRCGSSNKAGGRRVCSNRYIMEDALIKLFIMSWNEIASNPDDYQEAWNKKLAEGIELERIKTEHLMAVAKKGKIKELEPDLVIQVLDYIKVYESGKLAIKFYDGTEFECETE
jgi:DNA invertase Pin-like site-specific DNA recombinase